jgi:hypothetical protein
MSDSTHDWQDDPTGNDDGGQGAPSAEPTVPHLIGSGTAEQVRPSTADQLTTVAPLGSSHSKKKHLVLASKRKQYAPFDQVTTEFFPHHVPRCSLGLVTVKLCNAPLRLLSSTLLLGLTFSQTKGFGRLR